MTDRPLPLRSEKVRALLQGRATQHRVVLRDQPGDLDRVFMFDDGSWHVCDSRGGHMSPLNVPFRVGDWFWARETWQAPALMPIQYRADPPVRHGHWDGRVGPWRPSIHMPRWASRITLFVTDVRVQRFQDISEEDAIAEGVEYETADPPFYYVPGIEPHSLTGVGVEEPGGRHAARSFGKLWDIINGAGSWASNPWVAVLTFSVIKENIDALQAREEVA